ncbi:MAG: glycosyltransferase family 9 protein [Gemmatimonadales bacterium]
MSARSGWRGEPPRDICIVMLSAIGDAVHVLPVANALKRAWPACRITWVVQPAARALVAGHPAIDELVLFERRRGLRAIASFRDVAAVLRPRRFDLLLGLQVYAKAGLITALTPARIKLGFDFRRARDAQWLFTNARIPAHAPQHVQDQYFEFLAFLGVDPEPVTWGLAVAPHERAAQAAFFSEMDAPACAVVVGTSRADKNWAPDRYARLLEQVTARFGLQPVIVGGPSSTEREIAERVIAETKVPVVDALGPDLRRLLWLLDGSALVVTPDTGPLHIARAIEKPVVSLFGRTNPKRSGPYRMFEDLVVDGYARYPGEPYSAAPVPRDGMARVTVDAVLEKIELVLARYLRPGISRATPS